MSRIRLRPEEQEQRALAAWLNLHPWIQWQHTPNQKGTRKPWEMGILKAMGVKAGSPDNLIFTTPPRCPAARGVAIEMKAPGRKATPNQLAFLAELGLNGWMYRVCQGAGEAIAWLEELGFGKRPPRSGPFADADLADDLAEEMAQRVVEGYRANVSRFFREFLPLGREAMREDEP